VEAFTNAVRLRALGLGARVIEPLLSRLPGSLNAEKTIGQITSISGRLFKRCSDGVANSPRRAPRIRFTIWANTQLREMLEMRTQTRTQFAFKTEWPFAFFWTMTCVFWTAVYGDFRFG
jgi:hypothetical protein